ncbi:hypothetical protein BD289DRAFT_30714 [Coniella lustricola]|uniref:Uncharacterized protein n=1 Tax=Coniella lustricola TaxID=2025994 RepID=A0A2T3A2Y2_9PEZI|nr:hypothetical protein BD289DRAFT_30714 [Coniella lustricola]
MRNTSVSSNAPSRARQIHTGSAHGSANRIMDPPRAARDGFEWVWYPEGYWAERQMERRSRPKEQSVSSSTHNQGQTSPIGKLFSWSARASRSPKGRAADDAEMEQDRANFNNNNGSSSNNNAPVSMATTSTYNQIPPHLLLRNNLPQSPYLSESEQVALLQQPSEPTTIAPMLRSSRDTWMNSAPPMSGAIGDAFASKNKHPASLSATAAAIRAARGSLQLPKTDQGSDAFKEQVRTAPIAEDMPSYFNQVPIRAPSHSPLPQTEAIASGPSRLHPLPTPRRVGSVPQGLRKLFAKGSKSHKDPTPPESGRIIRAAAREKRTKPGSRTSFKSGGATFNQPVHIPNSSVSYPTGKVVRVQTPPLKQQTANGNPRSLFIDLKHRFAPEDGFGKSASDSTKTTSRPSSSNNSSSRDKQSVKREWWDKPPRISLKKDPVPQTAIATPAATTTSGTTITTHEEESPQAVVPSFEFKLPEHLPSSPMCPANPMYKGKGRMVCVYHGRGKQASVDGGTEPLQASSEMDGNV